MRNRVCGLAILLALHSGGALFAQEAPPKVPQEVQTLVAQLGSKDPIAKATAAHQLGRLGKTAQPAAPYLLPLLKDHTSLKKNLVPGLKQAIEEGENPYMTPMTTSPCQEACIALGRIGDPVAVAPLCAVMLEMLKTEYWIERREATKALGLIGDPGAAGALLSVITDPRKQYNNENEAAASLAQLGAPVVPAVLSAARGSSGRVQATLIAALGKMGAAAVTPLAGLLNGGAPEAAHAAAVALAQTQEPEALAALLAAVKGKNSAAQSAATAGLEGFCAHLNSPRASPRARGGPKAPANPEPVTEDRERALMTRLQDEVAAPLAAVVKDALKAAEHRKSAIAVLVYCRDPQAVEPLVAALTDRNDVVRLAAFYAVYNLTRLVRTDSRWFSKAPADEAEQWKKTREALDAGLKEKAPGPLIESLAVLERAAPGKDKDRALAAAQEVLQQLTGQQFSSAREWSAWWKKQPSGR